MSSEGPKSLSTVVFSWLALSALILLVNSMPIERQVASDPHAKAKRSTYQACGSNLDDLVSFVCQGNFNSRFDDKRSTGAVNRGISQHPVAELIRHKRQNIVAECCWKSCSYETLRLYCADR